jgi:signal transduction histidine kinase/DNA-binding response OmpR family regulator
MPRVLVVDDEPEIARMLVALLRESGFESRSAGSGEEALEVLASTGIGLVILDVLLPGIDGFEVCRRIRQRYGPALPVVLLTGLDDAEAVRRGYEAGADDFVRKPPDPASFALKVKAFLRSRQAFDAERRHAASLQRLSDLVAAMAATTGRTPLVDLTLSRVCRDLGYAGAAFFGRSEDGSGLRLDKQVGSLADGAEALDPGLLRRAIEEARLAESEHREGGREVAVPIQVREGVLGVLGLVGQGPPVDEEASLLSAIAGQLSVGLQKAESVGATERLAREMATLYELSLETTALRELRHLFVKATEDAGRLIGADHTSALRLDHKESLLKLFVAWAREPDTEPYREPAFKLGEGIAGRVARDRVPALVDDTGHDADFVPKGNPVARLICVPVTYFDREQNVPAVFGVLNATRRPGAPPFTREDLDYLTRFAGQLSVAVANSMAFAAERERGEQLRLVNTLLREVTGSLSRHTILETAARRIHQAFGGPAVRWLVPDREAGVFRVELAAGARLPPGRGPLPLDGGPLGRVLAERRTVLLGEPSGPAGGHSPFAAARSGVLVPILSSGEVSAVLAVTSEAPGRFDREQRITLETLADGIGISLRNAELFHALERTNAELVELDRLKSELVNVVAHDLRAPLSGVMSHAEMLASQPEAPGTERVDRARGIVGAAVHMANLVDKTLQTMRLDSGDFPFDFGIIDLAASVREVLERLPEDATHPVVLALPDDPVACWADRSRICQVLENLLSNAVKYSPDGGRIELELEREGEQATVAVRDRGVGLAVDEVSQLFRAFTRVRNERTAGIEGAGLGLYICDRILRAHGGRLWAVPRDGGGTSFSFTLPVYGAAAQSRAAVILIAAGDESTRGELRGLIEEMGLEVCETSHGVEALEAAARVRPGAIVLDRILPRLGAEAVAQRLKRSPATADTPLIALVGPTQGPHSASLFSRVLSKPLDRQALAAALDGALRRSH